jgi:hypothetical protein
MTMLFAALHCGCSGEPSPLLAPTIPRDAGDAAVKQYDSDADGAIGGDELAKAVSLGSALRRIDSDHNGKVSAAEINSRIQVWKDSKVGIMPMLVTVRQNGQPLSGAQVLLVPEPFLGSAVKPAQGTTNDRGTAILRISNEADERGVHLGFYRVEVSKKDSGGRESVAAKFNSQTEIGTEVATDDPKLEHLMLNVSAK